MKSELTELVESLVETWSHCADTLTPGIWRKRYRCTKITRGAAFCRVLGDVRLTPQA